MPKHDEPVSFYDIGPFLQMAAVITMDEKDPPILRSLGRQVYYNWEKMTTAAVHDLCRKVNDELWRILGDHRKPGAYR